MIEQVGLASAESPGKSRSSRRIKGLDVLRGLAATAVVFYHYTSDYQRVFGHHNGKPLFSLPQGALGVQLFFIISGFVIFMTLIRCRTPMEFVRSRFSRLFPAFWAALAITAAVLHFYHLPDRTASAPRIAANFTMVPGLLGVGFVDPVYWTLQVELCFYGIMLLIFATGQLRHAVWFMLGLLALSVLMHVALPPRGAFLAHHPHLAFADNKLREILILGHIPSFLIGILIYENLQSPRFWHWGAIAACLGVTLWFSPSINFCSMLIFAALVYSAARGWLWFLENRVLLYLGFISYSLYLTHQNIGFAVIRALEGRGLTPNASILAALATALLIATALTYSIERPALRLLGKKKTGRSAQPVKFQPEPAPSHPQPELGLS